MRSSPVNIPDQVVICHATFSVAARWLSRLLIASLVHSAATARAQNFTSAEQDLCRYAETARMQSARFWSGQPLPGSWYRPCPMEWTRRNGPGSGATTFQIHAGEVFGWDMKLQGARTTVLRDVIPHEVDHAVRASLCRRPLPRWLDEGCASLFESTDSHALLRQQLMESKDRYLCAATIDQMNYPASGNDTARVYAEGFSLTEFLLSRGTPRELLQLQLSDEPPSRSLVHVYRSELPQLLTDWRAWESLRLKAGTGCQCVNCPWHHPRSNPKQSSTPTGPTRPTLTIWTATWCAPCRQFHQELSRVPGFREKLESNFTLIERDIDQSPHAAQQARITSVPVFETSGRRIYGYQGSDWLLDQLRLTAPSVIPAQTSAPESTTQPSKDETASTPASSQPSPTTAEPPSSTETPPETPALQTLESPSTPPTQPLNTGPPWSRVIDLIPTAITVLSSIGVIGGSAVTGGVGGIALMVLMNLIKRRATRSAPSRTDATPPLAEGGVAGSAQAPFPRQLDEARQLLELRQSEGRVATLDTLRGMFLDDELDKLKDDPDPQVAALIRRVREALDNRVDEVAPLTTKT